MTNPLRRAVFLDRDGVLIHSPIRDGRPYAIREGEEMRLLEGSEAACEALKRHGFHLVMVTNQPDIGRGLTSPAFVQATNEAIAARLALDAIKLCPHDDSANCDCRKPKPGLLLNAAAELGISLSGSIMVGDRWRDVEAGRRAGCHTVLIEYGYDEAMPNPPDHRASSLHAAVSWICARASGEGG